MAARQAEVAQRPHSRRGKIPRPLNAFLLYRMAYKNRAMAFRQSFRERDRRISFPHILAFSWKMEPEGVRREFAALVEVEKKRHAGAFPGWKYRPVVKGRKRAERASEPPVDNADADSVYPTNILDAIDAITPERLEDFLAVP
ncbi:hypothetical protein N657DRAFT_671147 [Parathielavia appendiculata]|uniref:HMG box domain-containing protein n=1 Tax=Parathielavia appendiculata TaxID=2587402 RepID=A0AAN6Z3N6_9PEZI|nr:hypothetical protein N657DRAFT_671147 [Parathielavia appendiculata]